MHNTAGASSNSKCYFEFLPTLVSLAENKTSHYSPPLEWGSHFDPIVSISVAWQRFCGEHGVKLGKVDKLFLTGTGAEEHAGLSGLVLTLSGLGSPALEVFGPTGVDKVVVRRLQ